MQNTMFMRVEDVAEEMGVSVAYAYKLIRKLNKELKATGCKMCIRDRTYTYNFQ